MNSTTREVAENTRRLIITQAIVGLVVATGFIFAQSLWVGVSALFGAAVSVVITLMLGSGVKRAGAQAAENPKKSMGILYFGAVQRFVVVLVLFVLGLGLMGLDPLALAVGFGRSQLGYLFSFRRLSRPAG